MADYVSDPEFDSYVGDEIGAANAANRTSAKRSAKRDIDKYCARNFDVAGASATARLYVPNGTDVLRIHDCTEVTSISVSGTTLSASTYQLEPVGVALDGEARPYEQVRLLLDYWRVTVHGEATVTVTAKWGWSATPYEVPEVNKQLGRLHLLRRRMGLNDSEWTEILARLDHLRRPEAFGWA